MMVLRRVDRLSRLIRPSAPFFFFLLALLSLHATATAQSQATAPTTAIYEDKLIEYGKLAPDDSQSTGNENYNAAGLPRFLRLETQLGQTRLNDSSSSVSGIQAYAQFDTAQYGALSVDYAWRKGLGTSQALTIRQLALPMNHGWQVNNALGVFTPLGTELARDQARFVLPSNLIEGIGTEWSNESQGLSLSASIGQPSLFEGAQLPQLRSLGGRLSNLSAQLQNGSWQFAAAGTHRTLGANNQANDSIANASVPGSSFFVGVKHRLGEESALQFSSLRSSSADAQSHVGVWIDGYTKIDGHRHGAGLFHFDRDLSWAGLPTVSGLDGAYYRYNYANRQWSIDANLESLRAASVSLATTTPNNRENSQQGYFASLGSRYQYSRQWSMGGGLATRNLGQSAWSAYGFTELAHTWGQTRTQLDTAHEGAGSSSLQWSIDHMFNVQAGTRLSSSLALGRTRHAAMSGSTLSIGLLSSTELLSNLSLDGSIRSQRSNNAGNSTATNISIGMSWRMNSHWSLQGNYYQNRGSFQNYVTLDPLTVVPLSVNVNSEQSFNLVLRYEDRAGSPSIPLGGRPGDASGRISGIVYLDANENGRRDAAEASAPNVSLILDERYVVRTDKDGRYQFPLVAAGAHTLRISTEDLPLPWSINSSTQEVNVRARETTEIDFGTTRLK